jgi:hypothetical protein
MAARTASLLNKDGEARHPWIRGRIREEQDGDAALLLGFFI